jgi:flavin-dependent thymidylate synthase
MKSSDTRISLLSATKDPQRICTFSARVSSLPGILTDIYENTPTSGHPDSLRRIISMGHKSVAEHANFSIAFENVSVFAEQYLITHRLASFTVKSRRYVSHADAGYVIPLLTEEGESNLWGDSGKPYVGPEFYGPLSQRYIHYTEGLFLAYKKLIKLGIPQEDARFVLPYSFKSNFIITTNARNWIHIIYDAIHGRGAKYPEIVWIGSTIKRMLSEIAPALFSKIESFEVGRWRDRNNIINRFGSTSNDNKYKPEVRLISYTPNPDNLVAVTALMTSANLTVEQAQSAITEDNIDDIISEVVDLRHARELEQTNFTFQLDGMSLATLTHLTRHRIQSIIIPELATLSKHLHVIEPESIKNNTEAHSIFESVVDTNESFSKVMDRFSVGLGNRVYTLLSGQAISIVTTMNARELMNFFTLRACNRAQWEIRHFAETMLNKLKDIAPLIFKEAGPSCVRFGKCQEGRLSCKRGDEMRRRYLGEG